MKDRLRALKQFIQFNIVGVLNTAVDFLAFTLFTEALGVTYLPAKTLSYACGILNSYIMNTSWTFRQERKRTKREVLLFVLVNLVSLGASLLTMYILRTSFGVKSDFICNLVATPVSMLINFTGNKLVVFREDKPASRVK